MSLGAQLEVLGGSQGRPLEVLGGAWGVFWDSLGCLGGSYWAIGVLMKTFKHLCFLFCFEHLEVLGRALGILLRPWGLLWGTVEGPGWALGGPGGSLGILGGFLRGCFSQGNLQPARPGRWEG